MGTLPSFDLESRLAQLDKLLAELLAGRFKRTTFQPWEIEVLLDIQACNVAEQSRKALLKRYQKAAHRWFDRGGRTLLLLSDYLSKRHCRTPVNGAYATGGARWEDEANELS